MKIQYAIAVIIFAVIFSFVGGMRFAAHRFEPVQAGMAASNEGLMAYQSDLRAQVDKLSHQVADLRETNGVLRTSNDSVQSRADAGESCETLERATASVEQFKEGWYTLLYDPAAAAPVSGSSTIELLNLLRPGLGTALAKLQPPVSSQGQPRPQSLHWVLPGMVKPIVIPPGSHSVWSHQPIALALPSGRVQ